MEIKHVAMGNLDSVVVGVPGGGSILYSLVRLLGGAGRRVAMVRAGHHGDGVQHGDLPIGAQHGDPGDLRRTPETTQWSPPYILGGIALVGLLVYAFKNGMDAVTAGMLSGLLSGILGYGVGRSTARNGK